IGLAKDTTYFDDAGLATPILYVPIAQDYRSAAVLLVKTNGKPGDVIPIVRSAAARVSADIPVSNAMALDDLAYRSLLPVRIALSVAGIMGLLALGMAAMGLYGVVSFIARQRTREIGIRMAMGATPSGIVQVITRQATRWIVIGLGLGFAVSAGLNQLLRTFLYG